MTSKSLPPLEDVLNAFAVEDADDKQVLAKYLDAYPEYAEDLIDLSREIHRSALKDDIELSARDKIRIEAAWQRFSEGSSAAVADPLSALSVAEIRQIAATLGVKRQVLAAFREHRVIVASIPARFLSRLAAAAKTSVEQLQQALSAPASLSPVRSFNSDVPPEVGGPITFEKLLRDAGHSEAERLMLLSEHQ